jgi:hypothetical protein
MFSSNRIAWVLVCLMACDGPTGSGPDGSTPQTDGGREPDAGPVDGGTPIIPADHPRIYLDDANRARLTSALEADAPAAARFRDMVDAELAGTEHYAFRASDAALLYALTGEAGYATHAIEMVDAYVSAEETRIAAGERAEVAGDSYLYVGDVVGDLALVYDWCFDRLTEAQRARWIAYANQAVWNVWNHEEARWGDAVHPWSGWSIDNPSNNYYYSFLEATMLLGLATTGENDQAEAWIERFRTTKLDEQLRPIFDRDLVGGGSREGTGYGTAMRRLFWLYDLWHGTTGESLSRMNRHTYDSLAYLMHSTVPTLDRLAPIGDHARDSSAALFDYHRAYALVLMRLFAGDRLAEVGASFVRQSSVPEVGQYFMYFYDFVHDDAAVEAEPLAALSTTYHASGVGHVFTRSSWDEDAAWVGVIAGPYTESHAHRDQGSFLLYHREWLAYDANVESHSGIVQDESLHNLVRIEQGGEVVRMRAERSPAQLVALEDDARFTYVATDVTPIYDGHAAITRSERELVFLRPGVVVVFDRVDAASDASRIFTLNTPITPEASGSTITMTGTESSLVVHRVGGSGTVSVTAWPDVDAAEYGGGHRIDVTETGAGGRSRMLHVLSIDGAVTAVSAADAAGTRGVRIERSGGEIVTVRFQEDAFGAALEDASGTVTLGEGVEALPLFAP